MNAKPVSPEKITQLTTAHWALKALAVAVDLSVFTSLRGRSLTAAQLAELLQLPLRSLERLLNANAALGFLEKADDTYRNAEIAEVYLVEGTPDDVDTAVREAIEAGVNAIWPSCDIWPTAPRENMEAMMAAARKYGKLD